MRRLALSIPLAALALGSCSYSYDLKAVVIGGKLAFVVDPNSRHDPSCINQIDVIASGGEQAKPTARDDASRVRYGTFWYERLEYDCVDKFPIFYGQKLKGKPRPLGQARETVSAKPLRPGVVYEVSTSGAGGYGGGAFKILANRTVLNVPQPPMAAADDSFDPMNPVTGNGS